MPLTLASTLVQLTLGNISVDWFWDSFVVDNPSSTSTSGLTFYCLSINLSQFRHLRSIEAQIEDELPDYCSTFINKWLSDMLATAGSQLEHLSIMLGAEDGFRLRITAPPAFARNITSLKLDDHIAIDDVGLILQQLPNLIRLELGPRMLVELACRLPPLEILRVAVSPIEDIQDAVNLLVNSGIASELIGHLRKLQIRSEA
ncbi:hypothetical protein IWW57_003972, partial [Coemansia sp. S610]